MNDLASREMREWPQLPKTLLAGLLRLVRMVLCKLARRVGWSSHRTRGPTGQTLTADRGCSWAWWLSTTSIAAWVEFVACNRGDRQLKRRRFYHDQGTFRHFSWLAVFLNWETSVSQALFVQHGEWCKSHSSGWCLSIESVVEWLLVALPHGSRYHLQSRWRGVATSKVFKGAPPKGCRVRYPI
jgi:hypothetical protein